MRWIGLILLFAIGRLYGSFYTYDMNTPTWPPNTSTNKWDNSASLTTATNSNSAGTGFAIKVTNAQKATYTIVPGDDKYPSQSAGNFRATYHVKVTPASDTFVDFLACARVFNDTGLKARYFLTFGSNGSGGSSLEALQKDIPIGQTFLSVGSTSALTNTIDFTIWYNVSIACVDSTISARIQRDSDSKYMTSSGTFTTSAVDIFSTTDTSITGMSGAVGFQMNAGASSNIVCDTVTIDQLAGHVRPSNPITTITNFDHNWCIDGSYFNPSGGCGIYYNNNVNTVDYGWYLAIGEDWSGSTGAYYNTSVSQVTPANFLGFQLFKSRDQVNWENWGDVYVSPGTYTTADRPKLLYDTVTKTWYLYANMYNWDGTGTSGIGCFSAPIPEGPWTFKQLIAPKGDCTVYNDAGTGYLNWANGTTLQIVQLASSFTATTGAVTTITTSAGTKEAPCFIKSGSNYITFYSGQDFWNATTNGYSTATTALGAYTFQANPFASSAVESNSIAYRTQPNCLYLDANGTIQGVSERWNKVNQGDSSMFWYTPTISGTTVTISYGTTGPAKAVGAAPFAQGCM